MLIRTATIDDLPEIVNIYNASIPGRQATAELEPVTITQRQDWFATPDPIRCPLWVAIKDQQITGWLSLEKFKNRGAYGQTR